MLKIGYLSGAVDAAGVYRSWRARQTLGYFGASHLSDFYQVCFDLGAEGYVITTLSGEATQHELENFIIENRPPPSRAGSLYHFASALWLAKMIPAIVKFRPQVLIITAGQNYWFLLGILRLFGIKIIPVYTTTPWPQFAPVRTSWRFLLWLNRIFLARCTAAIVTVSGVAAHQIRSMLRGKSIPVTVFLPIYPRNQFSAFSAPNFDARPFNIFFAGRIETNKGVYDLVEVARRLNERAPGQYHFDICGEGSELDNLRTTITTLGMTKFIKCHGMCDRSKLSSFLQDAHAVIVPTTAQFEEGFNMVCAESILAGRPLITSAVCPALDYVKEAAIEVPPDNVSAYFEAILHLSNDRGVYERKVLACKPLQEQFYNEMDGWGNKLRVAIRDALK
jgi:glycosyltransferase involved in cell wall biosynthesis